MPKNNINNDDENESEGDYDVENLFDEFIGE